MKITIANIDDSGLNGSEIFVGSKKLENSNGTGINRRTFSPNEIWLILGSDSAFSKYESGVSEFDVPKWKLDIVSGVGLKNPTSAQNKFSYQYHNQNK